MSSSVGARHRPEARVGAAPDPGRLTILVADDEPAIRSAIGQLLTQQGYRVLEAVDGLEALAVAARHPGPIHLLLTDLGMPRLDGHELHRRLNHQRPETRTLFMSGSPETGLQPAAAFLPKPFGARTLVRKVNQLLRGRAR